MREEGFYWVQMQADTEEMTFVAYWAGSYWLLPGNSDQFTDEHFSFITSEPITPSFGLCKVTSPKYFSTSTIIS